MARNSESAPAPERTLTNLIQDGLHLKGISIERLAQITGISERFLGSLVEEKYQELPPAPYVRSYLIKIAQALGLDGNELWQEYLAESELIRRAGEHDTLPQNRFTVTRFNWKLVAAVLAGVIVLIYVLLHIPSLVDAYKFSVNIPDSAVVSQADFTIQGTVNENDQLTLDGEILYSDSNGKFEKLVTLKEGWNTFEFKVKRLLGAEKTFTKQIFYQGSTTPPAPQP